jgi:hypothetical protein
MRRSGAAIGLVTFLLAAAGPLRGAAIFELRSGYFFPASSNIRDVYKGGLAFGADISVPFARSLCAWFGIDYFRKAGHLTFTQETTMIEVIPIFAGLKLQPTSRSVGPYLGLAAGYFFFKETNPIGIASGQKIGMLAQLGLLIRLAGAVSLDLHGRYTLSKYRSAEPEAFTTDLGGFQGGLGVALKF